MLSLKQLTLLAAALLCPVSARNCKPEKLKTTLETLTKTGTWITGVPAPSSVDDGVSLTGVPAPSSTATGTWLGSSNNDSIPGPSSTVALGSSKTPIPIGGGGIVPLTCYPSANSPKDTICGSTGFVDMKYMTSTYTGPATSELECMRFCTMTQSCSAFSYDAETNLCLVGTRPWSDADFTPDNGPGAKSWDQAECWECYDSRFPTSHDPSAPLSTNTPALDSILKLDFEDGNIDDWTLEANFDFDWFMDSPEAAAPQGRALRIGEPQGADAKGEQATATYGETFYLTGGKTYTFAYKMRVENNNYLVKNYDAITIYISTNDEIIYEFTPKRSDAIPLQGFEEFTPHSTEEGEATLSVTITGIGHGFDYYFDSFVVTW
ncbi:hypothetical protein FDECE_12453 [Fusarium decemcellulare]|nr:hypothetical protein FDECE_12453 [Fusarium decemcellulare]